MRRFLTLLPFAYLLYRIYFTFLNKSIQIGFLVACLFLYLFLNLPVTLNKYGTHSVFIKACLFLFFLILLTLLIPILHGTSDFSYATSVIRTLSLNFLSWLAFACYVAKHSKKGKEIETFTDFFSYISTLYVSFTLLCVMFPPLRSFWEGIIDMSEKSANHASVESQLLRFGWIGFSDFAQTVMMSLGVLLCVACLSRGKSHWSGLSNTERRKYYFYIYAMLVGNICYGRSGLAISCLILLIYWIRNLILYRNFHHIIYVALFALLSGCAGTFLYETVPVLQPAFQWVLEPIENFLSGRGLSSDSTDHLQSMITDTSFSIKTLLMGDGYYFSPNSTGYYKSVDLGFYRMTFFGGIFFSAYILLSGFSFLRQTALCRGFVTCLFLVFITIFESKGEVALTPVFVFGAALAIIAPKRIRTQPLY